MSDILTITEGSNFNESLQINIETQDLFLHPSESYLVVEGRLLKNDDTAYADGDLVLLTHNGIMYLFKASVIGFPVSRSNILTTPASPPLCWEC